MTYKLGDEFYNRIRVMDKLNVEGINLLFTDDLNIIDSYGTNSTMTVEEPKVPVHHSEDLFYKNSFKVEAVGANNAVKEIDNENGIYKITSNGDSQGQNAVYINGFDKNKRYIVSFNVKLDSRSNNFKLKGILATDHFTSDRDYYVNGN